MVVSAAMEEGAMEHHEAVVSEVAFGVVVAAEAMRHTDAYDHQSRPTDDQDLGETVTGHSRRLLDFCDGVRRACTTIKRPTKWIPGQNEIGNVLGFLDLVFGGALPWDRLRRD